MKYTVTYCIPEHKKTFNLSGAHAWELGIIARALKQLGLEVVHRQRFAAGVFVVVLK